MTANNLTGRIPPGIWSLEKLLFLFLSANKLTGEVVVDGVFGALNLLVIHLAENPKLGGPIPEGFGLLQNLGDLSLHSSNFSGKIPPSIGRLRSLRRISLDNNSLTGILPSELGQHSPELWYISVSDNELTGPIPKGLCDNGKLEMFVAGNNRLNGSIPKSLVGCTTLTHLQLGNNTLSGRIM
uniref:Uncharacterized protein n=1 Tax=Leersia perrieri TaxID=77586 RepID=A0A0D9V0D3_9ORYZ